MGHAGSPQVALGAGVQRHSRRGCDRAESRRAVIRRAVTRRASAKIAAARIRPRHPRRFWPTESPAPPGVTWPSSARIGRPRRFWRDDIRIPRRADRDLAPGASRAGNAVFSVIDRSRQKWLSGPATPFWGMQAAGHAVFSVTDRSPSAVTGVTRPFTTSSD